MRGVEVRDGGFGVSKKFGGFFGLELHFLVSFTWTPMPLCPSSLPHFHPNPVQIEKIIPQK